ATASPPNVNGPPGQAWVLNMAIPKLERASKATGAHDLPASLSDTAAATAPTDNAMLPNTARKGAGISGEPPMIGCVQTASIEARHASGVPDLWAALMRIPVTTPAAVSNAV